MKMGGGTLNRVISSFWSSLRGAAAAPSKELGDAPLLPQTIIIKNKLGLQKLAEKLGNVTEACQVYGYSRDSFYRIKELFETGGEIALKEVSRKKPNYKNRIEPEIEKAVIQIATDEPALGQVRVSNELKRKGIFISPCGVRCVWLRNDLETFAKRLRALEAIVARDGLILTEAQIIAMERKKEKKEATGEIETEHPGYLGAQDTYYVGNIKGVGRIYQQTLIDMYSKVAMAKLYSSIDELQVDLDLWIDQYNLERTHSGKYCFGKTTWRAFRKYYL